MLWGGDSVAAGYLPTSHDIVQRVRRWSGQRRIGHTGTLDPMASGVLVLCLGTATRLVEYYQGHDKCYLAQVRLGVETDTYDAVGTVTRRLSVPALSTVEIETALNLFRGPIQQKPPIFSALKQDGESLHQKARRGEAVEVTARSVTIHAIDLLSFTPPDTFTVRVHCSAGTYIRSLAYDLGMALGTTAHLSSLRRERAGSFSEQAAHSMESIEAAANQGALPDLLLTSGAGLEMPALSLDAENCQRLGYGQKLWLPAIAQPVAVGDTVQGLDEQGQLVGILSVLEIAPTGDALLSKADKWFAPQAQI